MRKWGALIAAGSIIAIFAWLPIISVPVSPEITLRVVNESGEPQTGIAITQFWGHWTYENKGHEDEKISDDNGYVTFSEKSIKVSTLRFVFYFLAEHTIGIIAIHNSSGPHSSFSANGFANTEVYSQCSFSGCEDDDGPKQIVLK